MKKCPKCQQEKELSCFGSQPKRKDGLRPWCKECHNKSNARWRESNPAAAAAAVSRWYKENKSRRAKSLIDWRLRNPERTNELAREWRKANPEKAAKANKRSKQKQAAIPKHVIRKRVSEAVRKSLGDGKLRGCFTHLGYSPEELKDHLERQFLPGMSWEKMSEWHIDHIVPLASFEYETQECPSFRKAWALTNLRPMWAKDNMSKGAKRLFLI